MPKTAYQISLKGYGGGYDFDRSTVDKELAKNEGKQVNVLIDSLGGWLATKEALDRGFVDENIDLDDEPAPKLTDALAQVGSPLAIENAHRNLLDMEDDE